MVEWKRSRAVSRVWGTLGACNGVALVNVWHSELWRHCATSESLLGANLNYGLRVRWTGHSGKVTNTGTKTGTEATCLPLQVIELIGEPRRNRTFNLRIKSPLLCQLS